MIRIRDRIVRGREQKLTVDIENGIGVLKGFPDPQKGSYSCFRFLLGLWATGRFWDEGVDPVRGLYTLLDCSFFYVRDTNFLCYTSGILGIIVMKGVLG